jgi:hypothetical protein
MLRAALISIVLITAVLPSMAQLLHYVYVQSENKTPFIVRHEGKRHVSSAAGYVLLSRLESRVHSLELRLLSDTTTALTFEIPVIKDDIGFFLKHMESGEWVLVNLITLELLRPVERKNSAAPALKTDDAFTNILAEVVNTPSLREIQVQEAAEKNRPGVIDDWTMVRKLETSLENNIRRMRYLSRDDQKVDTIMLEMEYPAALRHALDSEAGQGDGIREWKSGQSTALLQRDSGVVEKSSKEGAAEVAVAVEEAVAMKEKNSLVQKFCNSSATQDDFFKLRKKMAGVNTDKAMLQLASRAFGSRCYTTEQVRNLSVLFLNDAGKLEFLEIAYPSVYDRERFSELESLFAEVESKNRFRSITGKIR